MQKFLIVQVLKTFTPAEIKEFEKFVKSPYFGGSNYLISFLNVLKRYHPEFSSSSIKKEKIFKKLYPGKMYNDVTMRKLSSDLFDMAEKFLALKEYEGSWMRERRLLAEYRSRRLYSLFEKQWKKLQQRFNRENQFEYDFLIQRHFSELENINYHSARKMEIENYENNKNFYEYLISYSLNYIMNGTVSQFVYSNAYNITNDENLLKFFVNSFNFEDFLKKVGEIDYQYKDVLELNYTMMEMFLNISDHSKYFSYKNKLLKFIMKVTPNSRYFYLTKLINACKFKMRARHADFHKEIFNVYKYMSDNDMLVEPNRKFISEFVFHDIVEYGVENGNIKWVDDFIESNIKLIIPDTRDKTYAYSKGVLEFFKKNYEKSLEYFSKLKGDLSHSKYHIREYTLKNYYELSYFDPAEAMVDSLRHFLKSVKYLSEKMRSDYSLFLKYYSRLLLAKRDNKKENAVPIMNDLKKEKFPEKEWLLEKAKELLD